MSVQNVTTARFVLQCLFEELEEYDRCIPVARGVQVGDVSDALLTVLSNRELQRLSAPKTRTASRRTAALPRVRRAVAKVKKAAAAKDKARLTGRRLRRTSSRG
jgi:hypothetical protein